MGFLEGGVALPPESACSTPRIGKEVAGSAIAVDREGAGISSAPILQDRWSWPDRKRQEWTGLLGLGELEVEEGLDQRQRRFRSLVGGGDEVPVAPVLDGDRR